MNKKTISTYLLIAFACFISTAQTIVYVSESGAGAKDGTSESDAIGGIGTAMSQITSEGDRLIIVGTVSTIGQNLL